MRLFIATLSTETNTFSPMATAMSGFEDYYLRYGTATSEPPNLMTEALHVWRRRGESHGWEIVESIAAIAEPAGPTTIQCYETLCGRLLSDLEAAGGADLILLQLHGAMVAEQVEDCEGDIAQKIRQIYPEATLAVALDLHCHLTEKMIEHCDLIVCFKEYPHDDATERAEELFDLAVKTRMGTIRPVMETYDCRMIHLYLTKTKAMAAFVDELKSAEREAGILSVSLAHGFPWADIEDVGAKLLVVADSQVGLARSTARRLGEKFFDLRHRIAGEYLEMDAALDQAQRTHRGPVVLADMGDNSGGGAPGDSTFLLHAMLERGLTNVATGLYWDPVSVRFCLDAGEGSTLKLRIGGKVGPHSGAPVDLEAQVIAIKQGVGQHLGLGLEPMGTVVRLQLAGQFDILINDLRTQVYHPEAFENMGIDLSTKAIVTVKSLFHFFAPFEKIATRIIQVATPGGTCPNFSQIPYRKRNLNYWPRVENPFRLDATGS